MAIIIPQNDRFKFYTATAGQTVFAYDFSIYEQTDLLVFQIEFTTGTVSELTVVTDYTVSGVGDQSGGNITLVSPAAVDDTIVILGDTPELRSTNYNAAGDFTKESVNTAFNKLVQICQQLRRDVDRKIGLEDYDVTDPDTVSMNVPLLDDRKGKYLYFNSDTGAVGVSSAVGIDGPADSEDKEVALFDGTDGKLLKRPGTEYMIVPQGTTGERGAPDSISLRGNTDGGEDVEVYVGGGWQSVLTGGTGAPINATYITQTDSGVLTNEQAMGNLATGIVKNITTTGVQSIAVEGTDYYEPGGTDVAVADGGTGDSTAAGARTNLGLEIGTDVQAHDPALDDISGLADPGADRILFWDDSAGSYNYLEPGTGISITGTSLDTPALLSLSDDPDPTVSANLNMNGNDIVDTNDNELVTFTETASAVNNLNISNDATGNSPVLSAVGDDTDIDINIQPKGTGVVSLGNYLFDADQTIGAGQDDYVLTYDDASGLISLEATGAASSGSWIFIDSSSFVGTASVEFTGLPSTYKHYVFIFNMTPSEASTNLFLQVSTDNGSSYINTNYINSVGSPDTYCVIAPSLNNTYLNGGLASGMCYIYSLTDSGQYTVTSSRLGRASGSTSFAEDQNLATRTVLESADAIRFAALSGTLTGDIALYGIKE